MGRRVSNLLSHFNDFPSLSLPTAVALTSNDVLQDIADSFVFDRQNALVEVPSLHMTDHCRVNPMKILINVPNFLYVSFYSC